MKKIIIGIFSLTIINLTFGQVVTPFTIRYQAQQKGDITFISNSAVSCNGGAGCNNGQNEIAPFGTATNNGFTSAYIDIDGDISTFMSSSDSLNLPNSSEISWAGLYWGGENQAGDPSFANRNVVKLKVNNGTYITLSADYLEDNTAGFNTYHCYKNITSILQVNGLSARYTLANIAARVGGTNQFAGWTIVIAYKNDLMDMKNLTVFNGLSNVSLANPITDISLMGLTTPPEGPVTFELGMVVYDGDRSSTGDQIQFNGNGSFVNISNAINPSTDVFNSTISNKGVVTPFRKPSLNNTLGYDADIFAPDNSAYTYLGNNQNAATIRQTTVGESFLTQVITITSIIDSDFDGDALVDYDDIDDDNDGILDATEMLTAYNGGDTDHDGNYDWNDRDSDNDGIADIIEARGIDVNGDGEVDGFIDINNDGWDDNIAITPLPGNDPDGDPNWNGADLDSDNDGITDVREAGGTDPDNNGQIGTGTGMTIPDTDSDGFSDLVDTDNGGTALTLPNTDGIGRPNYVDLDSDQDGICDNIEAQATLSYLTPMPSGNDADKDGIMDTYDNITGFGGIGIIPVNTDGIDNPDYRDTDTDNDGGLDAMEGWDTDNNGIANTFPSGLDTDADGMDNAYDVNNIIWYPSNLQTPSSFPNMDFIATPELDWREAGALDTDNDGTPNSFDVDDDNDGLLDNVELATAINIGDTDLDGITDNLDLDSDNDGIKDVIEAGGVDPDNDGIIGTGAITDTDGDGWSNITDSDNGGTALPNPDTDGDGKKNFQDVDSDGDTVLDAIENDPFATGNGPVDTDGDGIPNYIDPNDDNDPLATTDEADEDNDGVLDDCDGDAIPDYLDPNGCLFIPSGFSPNGDGINDTFVINGLMLYPGAKLSILNRWGNRVYFQAYYNNSWNGNGNDNEEMTIGGNALPIGTYFYILDLNDGQNLRSGYVYLNR